MAGLKRITDEIRKANKARAALGRKQWSLKGSRKFPGEGATFKSRKAAEVSAENWRQHYTTIGEDITIAVLEVKLEREDR